MAPKLVPLLRYGLAVVSADVVLTLYRRVCGPILFVRLLRRIRGWMAVMAETEACRITDQSGYLKVLVHERKYCDGIAESYEDRYEDVIRIESPHRARQHD